MSLQANQANKNKNQKINSKFQYGLHGEMRNPTKLKYKYQVSI